MRSNPLMLDIFNKLTEQNIILAKTYVHPTHKEIIIETYVIKGSYSSWDTKFKEYKFYS